LKLEIAKAERSLGLNFDVNYKTQLSEESDISINQLFFVTTLYNPIILSTTTNADGNYTFGNADGHLISKGFETNVRVGVHDLSVYLGYTFIDARREFSGLKYFNPLTAKHRINANILYELDENLRIAYELFYVGHQFLSSGEKVRDYWVMGISAEKKFNVLSVFMNAENFLDSRQTRIEPLYTGTIQNPQFREIYSPIDGFIFNGGFRLIIKN
jgi:outer membrane receptor for ferrienterochelin and colicins